MVRNEINNQEKSTSTGLESRNDYIIILTFKTPGISSSNII